KCEPAVNESEWSSLKSVVWVLALWLLVPPSLWLSQGQVNFASIPSLFVNDPTTDRFVSCIESGALVGTNWAAQLWYGVGELPATDLTMTADPIAHFRPPGTALAGTWLGGERLLPGTSPGQILTLQVRVWDTSLSPTYFGALNNGVPHGSSGTFDYMVPAPDAPPDAFVMYGFQGFAFTCVVPEPSTSALFVLAGVLGWCCYRRVRS